MKLIFIALFFTGCLCAKDVTVKTTQDWLTRDLNLEIASETEPAALLKLINETRNLAWVEERLLEELNKLNTGELTFKHRIDYVNEHYNEDNAFFLNRELNALPYEIDVLARYKDIDGRLLKFDEELKYDAKLSKLKLNEELLARPEKIPTVKRVDSRYVRVNKLDDQLILKEYYKSTYLDRSAVNQPNYYTGFRLKMDGTVSGYGLKKPISEHPWLVGYTGEATNLPIMGYIREDYEKPLSRTLLRNFILTSAQTQPEGVFIVIGPVKKLNANEGREYELNQQLKEVIRQRLNMRTELQMSNFHMLATYFKESGFYDTVRTLTTTQRDLLRPEVVGLNQLLRGKIKTVEDLIRLKEEPVKLINEVLAETLYEDATRNEKGGYECYVELYYYY